MTTTQTLPVAIPVTTPRGSRIPKVGTLCCHDAIGFATVVSRTQRTLRIVLDDLDGADDVTLRNGDVITRAAWLSRVAAASVKGANIEVTGIIARVNDEDDALYQARPFAKSLIASVKSRIRKANEMIVGIDGAEACGWEFDEYATWTPKKNIKKAKAPKPVAPKPVPSNVGTVEDPEMADWMVDEMNECFGEYWTPTADRSAAAPVHPDYKPNV